MCQGGELLLHQQKSLFSHLKEYVEYYGGPGVQHIAMNTSNIITAVSAISHKCGCIL